MLTPSRQNLTPPHATTTHATTITTTDALHTMQTTPGADDMTTGEVETTDVSPRLLLLMCHSFAFADPLLVRFLLADGAAPPPRRRDYEERPYSQSGSRDYPPRDSRDSYSSSRAPERRRDDTYAAPAAGYDDRSRGDRRY